MGGGGQFFIAGAATVVLLHLLYALASSIARRQLGMFAEPTPDTGADDEGLAAEVRKLFHSTTDSLGGQHDHA